MILIRTIVYMLMILLIATAIIIAPKDQQIR